MAKKKKDENSDQTILQPWPLAPVTLKFVKAKASHPLQTQTELIIIIHTIHQRRTVFYYVNVHLDLYTSFESEKDDIV